MPFVIVLQDYPLVIKLYSNTWDRFLNSVSYTFHVVSYHCSPLSLGSISFEPGVVKGPVKSTI